LLRKGQPDSLLAYLTSKGVLVAWISWVLILSLFAGPSLKAQPRTGPILYVLRATDKQGSSLIYIDEQGRETKIATDTRTAENAGVILKDHWASFWGPFAMSSDRETVLYSLVEAPSFPSTESPDPFMAGRPISGMGIPSRSGGSVAVGINPIAIFHAINGSFPTRKVEGIYLWSRKTGTSSKIWDNSSMKAALKAWEKGTKPYPFKVEVNFSRAMDRLAPLWMEPLKDGRFALVLPDAVVALDPLRSNVQPLYTGQPREANPPQFGDEEGDRSQPFRIWKDVSGRLNWVVKGEWAILKGDGSVDVQTIPLGADVHINGDQLIVGDGKSAWVVTRCQGKPEANEPLTTMTPSFGVRYPIPGDTDLLEFRRGGLAPDVQRVAPSGEVRWRASIQSPDPTRPAGTIKVAISKTTVGIWFPSAIPKTAEFIGLASGNRLAPVQAGSLSAFQSLMESSTDPVPMRASLPHDILDFDSVNRTFLAYEHKTVGEDVLTCASLDGKKLWTTKLGDCSPFFFSQRTDAVLWVVVRRTRDGLGHRLKIEASTGDILEDRIWSDGQPVDGGFSLGAELLGKAAFIPSRSGILIWIPAHGTIKDFPRPKPAGQTLTTVPLPDECSLNEPAKPFGGWYRLENGLILRPLTLIALGDRPMPMTSGGPILIPSWENYGFRNGGGTHIAPRIFPSSPFLASWAEQVLLDSTNNPPPNHPTN
jgi:hypothetical protein